VTRAAKLAGKHRADLYDLLKKHQLNVSTFKKPHRVDASLSYKARFLAYDLRSMSILGSCHTSTPICGIPLCKVKFWQGEHPYEKGNSDLKRVIAFWLGSSRGDRCNPQRKKGTVRAVAVQPPPADPTTAPVAPPPSPSPAEVNAKIQALKDIVQKDPKNLPLWWSWATSISTRTSPKKRSRRIASTLPSNPTMPM